MPLLPGPAQIFNQTPVSYADVGTAADLTDYASDVAAATIANGKYNAFGAMGQHPNGTLYTFYREGTAHVAAGVYGVIKMRTSVDEGRTWSAATTVASETSVDLRNVAASITRTGRIVLSYSRYNPDTSTWLSMGTRYSDDKGVTFSPFLTFSSGTMTVTASTTGQMMEIGAATLMLTWYGSDGTNYRCFVLFSSDNGATWGNQVTVATSTTIQYTEADFAYLGGSQIVGLIRDDVGTTYRQVKSADNGATWTPQSTTTFDTWTTPSPPCLCVFTDGSGMRKVACYYVNRTDGKLKVTMAIGKDLINVGVGVWCKPITLNSSANIPDSGYIAACHPRGTAAGVGWFYNNGGTNIADMVFFAVNLAGWLTYTPTATGFSGGLTSAFGRFMVTGRLVTLYFNIQGTSNTNAMTFLLPIPVSASILADSPIVTPVRDNSAWLATPGVAYFQASATSAIVWKDTSLGGAVFTTSGSKGAFGMGYYEI